jgi:glycosyltransferase involved in cell wall biosynthesis
MVIQPLVSVVIPSLPHRRKQLERALESVANQTYPYIEVIVEYGGKNVQDARNIAVQRSNGKYIAFMDDDDEWKPEKIAMQVLAMESNTEIALCITWG